MRALSIIFLAISFISVSLFGFVMVRHGLSHDACIAAVARGAVCPGGASPLAFISFHLTILKSFSEALLNIPLLLGIFAFIAALAVAFDFSARPPILSYDPGRVLRFLDLEFSAAKPRERLIHWLELLAKRDPRSIFEVA